MKRHFHLLNLSFLCLFFAPKTIEGNDIHSVITYNIKYDNKSDSENSWDVRKVGMLELMNSLSPDILCIQEGLNHQVEYLNSKLNDYKYVGVGRDDANKSGEFCAIFFNEKNINY